MKVLLEKATTIKKFEYLPLSSDLKMQTEIAKDQCKLFKDQKNNVTHSNREDDDNLENNMSVESNIDKKFDAILERNNRKTTKVIMLNFMVKMLIHIRS